MLNARPENSVLAMLGPRLRNDFQLNICRLPVFVAVIRLHGQHVVPEQGQLHLFTERHQGVSIKITDLNVAVNGSGCAHPLSIRVGHGSVKCHPNSTRDLTPTPPRLSNVARQDNTMRMRALR